MHMQGMTVVLIYGLLISGDGYLSTWDIRKPDVAAMSDNMEDELLSVKLLKVCVNSIEDGRQGT